MHVLVVIKKIYLKADADGKIPIKYMEDFCAIYLVPFWF